MQGFWLVPILGGGSLVLRAALDLDLARTTSRWPTVPGWLVRADIGYAPFGRFGRRIDSLHYHYQVDGADYDGDLLSYRRFWTVQAAETALYRLKEQKRVTVSYDPARPERAVLLPGTGPATTAELVIGILFVVGGVLGAWLLAI
jgi:hypothetical protein